MYSFYVDLRLVKNYNYNHLFLKKKSVKNTEDIITNFELFKTLKLKTNILRD